MITVQGSSFRIYFVPCMAFFHEKQKTLKQTKLLYKLYASCRSTNSNVLNIATTVLLYTLPRCDGKWPTNIKRNTFLKKNVEDADIYKSTLSTHFLKLILTGA